MAAEAVEFMSSRGANGGRAVELVTRDFLGVCAAAGDDDDARDVDARHQQQQRLQHDAVPPGKLSLHHARPTAPRDLNLFPVAASTPCPAVSPVLAATSSAGVATTYHSVCTIEKVKTALERFERGKRHQRSGAGGASLSSSSSSVTTSSVKRRRSGGVEEQGDGCDSSSGSGSGGMVASACPRCFLYVLISRSDPRCPRCESRVPAPPPPTTAVSKRPRIDLNVGT